MTSEEQSGSRWYVRMEDGKTYGPVTFDVLIEWAGQARVGPGTYISSDGTTWTPSESVAGLDIEWMVVPQAQTPFGPLNRSGVAQLVRDGVILPDVRVRNVKTRQVTAAGGLLAAVEAEEHQRTQSHLAELQEELHRVIEQVRHSAADADRERALREQAQAKRADQEQAFRTQVATLDQQVQSLAAAAKEEQSGREKREADLARQLDEAGRRIAALGAEAAAAQDALREHEVQRQRLQAKTDQLSDESAKRIAALAGERDAELQRTRDLKDEMDRGKSAASEAARRHEEQARLQTDRIRSVEKQVGDLRAELSEAERQRDLAVKEFGAVREELRRTKEAVERLAKPVPATATVRSPAAQSLPTRPASRPGNEAPQRRAAPVAAAPSRSAARAQSKPPPITSDGRADSDKADTGRGVKCPECGSTFVSREFQSPWMRLFALTRRYTCEGCGCEFVTLLGLFKRRQG